MFAWVRTSISGFSTEMSPTRASSYVVLVESGLVRKLEVPYSHLYFQAPGGQCRRLVGIDEDLSFYEGAGEGPKVAKVKEAIMKEALKK